MKSCGGVVTARYTNGSLLVLVTPWIVPAGVRTTSPARNPSVWPSSIRSRALPLLNEPYLFAHRVHMSCRGCARLHRDARDRDPGFGRIIGPHDLHRSKAGIVQCREVCRRETLDGQDRCRPFLPGLHSPMARPSGFRPAHSRLSCNHARPCTGEAVRSRASWVQWMPPIVAAPAEHGRCSLRPLLPLPRWRSRDLL